MAPTPFADVIKPAAGEPRIVSESPTETQILILHLLEVVTTAVAPRHH